MYLEFQTIPISSLTIIKPEDRTYYLDQVFLLNKKIQNLLFSEDTGAYVRGIGKTYDIEESSQPKIAFAILEIAIGKKSFAQLPAMLSTELQLPNDTAQKMAAEIEKDIFGPVRRELDEFLSRKVASQPRDVTERKNPNATPPLRLAPLARLSGRQAQGKPPVSPQNLLNLKELNAPKRPGQLPKGEETTRYPSPYEGGVRGGSQSQEPKFPLPRRSPLPPLRPSGSAGQAPRPPEPPIYFT